MKSGLGAYAVQVGDLQVGAVVAVNAVGDVLDENGQILAGMRSRDGQGFADTRRVMLEEAGQTPTLFPSAPSGRRPIRLSVPSSPMGSSTRPS